MYKYILLLCLLNTFLVFCILNDILICSLVLILNNIFVYIEWYNWQKQFSDYWVPGIHVHNDGMTLGPKGEPKNSDDRRWCAHFKHEYDQLLMIFFPVKGWKQCLTSGGWYVAGLTSVCHPGTFQSGNFAHSACRTLCPQKTKYSRQTGKRTHRTAEWFPSPGTATGGGWPDLLLGELSQTG